MTAPAEEPLKAGAGLVPVVEPVSHAETLHEEDPAAPKVGRWYHVQITDDGREKKWSPRLGCVVHDGSNYVEVKYVGGSTERIHDKDFWKRCTLVEDADALIDARVEASRREVHALMEEVKQITARLSITPTPSLTSGTEAHALALHSSERIEDYKAALVLAEKKTLPKLFQDIKDANGQMAMWMGAKLIPLEAEVEQLAPAIGAIKRRIFSVSLYAGLVEQVEQIQDGPPAELTEPLHLFQRRAYMDEECLAHYEVGGMEFKDIGAFDAWLCKPQNLNRILPFPRCLLAFRVRRKAKARAAITYSQFVRMMEDQELDERTFLYIRNGAQVFRLSTEIEFDEQLFPDMDHHILSAGRKGLYAKLFCDEVREVISEEAYQGMVEEERAKEREIVEKKRAAAKLPKKDRPYLSTYINHNSREYRPFSRDDVYYDDISRFIHDQGEKHNRVVLVLQGLLDRSPVLHPHPPWKLYSDEGFTQALRLHYDNARALVAGDKPDFEAFRARLNASLAVGSVTVGQEEAWERSEAKKEHNRRANDPRLRHGEYTLERYRPFGNPGPGTLARVARVQPRAGRCAYQWTRDRQRPARDAWGTKQGPERLGCTFSAKLSRVLNVDAYKPGDYRQFFNDPRTRAQYLQWAGLLLVAEEYHAGNRKAPPAVETLPVRTKDPEASRLYHLRRARKALVGKAVRLVRKVTTKGGNVYENGSLWRVTSNTGNAFELAGILEDGTTDTKKAPTGYRSRCVSGMSQSDFVVDSAIPGDARFDPKPDKRPRRAIDDDEGDDD